MKSRLPLRVYPALFSALWCFTGALASAQAPAKPVPVIFETELGRITLEVDVAHAPVTSANFLRYVDGKFYDGGEFIRAVRPDNTVRHDVEIHGIQAGSDPARDKEQFPPIPLERTTVTGLKHLDGTISMARGEPNSATSSFWIAIGDQLSLDFGGNRNPDGQGFATFGRVIGGMDVVKRIQAAHTGTDGPFRTESLQPAIRILRAHRATRDELVAPPLGAQQPARWFATWAPSPFAAAPKPPVDSMDRVPTYADRTIRQIVRTTIGGDRLRIRFTNEFGERPLVIGAAHVAERDSGASIRAGTDQVITFGGRTSVTVRRGALIVSDPVEMRVPALTDIAVSIWVKDTTRASTRHALGLQTNYVSPHGDFTAAPSMHADTTVRQWLWLAGVDVVNSSATGVIVAIGNSITDGAASSADSNSRWPDVLARRLLASKEPLKAVVNAGISGNGVLSPITGPAALGRFDRDVLMQPGVTHVIVLEGINDIGRGLASPDPRDSVRAQDLIYGYQQLISRAHERGLVIFGATLTPMGNMTGRQTAAGDAIRRAVNEWIRMSGAFDGVIDFEAATRDPSDPTRFLPAYDSGDHLHPSDAGYKAMGESIDLTLFRKTMAARRP